jgi:KipI family sensor histidine kinase inhibitor
VQVHPLGEAAWTIQLGDRVDPLIHARVLELAASLQAAALAGVREIVPAYAAVTVFFDPARGNAEQIREWIAKVGRSDGLTVARSGAASDRPPVLPSSRPPVEIPVHYDGPDLEFVASRTGLTRDEVIRRHSGRAYTVYLLGFAPGFAYLGDLDASLILPRRSEPRLRVPAGSVAIAGAQTAVYPLATPGGWHLLGRTALKLFDPQRAPAALLAPGDRVRFEPVALS